MHNSISFDLNKRVLHKIIFEIGVVNSHAIILANVYVYKKAHSLQLFLNEEKISNWMK